MWKSSLVAWAPKPHLLRHKSMMEFEGLFTNNMISCCKIFFLSDIFFYIKLTFGMCLERVSLCAGCDSIFVT